MGKLIIKGARLGGELYPALTYLGLEGAFPYFFFGSSCLSADIQKV